MPKMKTHRGAAKRFKTTPNGKIRRRRSNVNHLLEGKTSKRKRRLRRADALVSEQDSKRIRRMLGQ